MTNFDDRCFNISFLSDCNYIKFSDIYRIVYFIVFFLRNISNFQKLMTREMDFGIVYTIF